MSRVTRDSRAGFVIHTRWIRRGRCAAPRAAQRSDGTDDTLFVCYNNMIINDVMLLKVRLYFIMTLYTLL